MEWILKIRYILWGPFTIFLIAATGLVLTGCTRGVQFWCVRHLLHFGKSKQGSGISPFQALCTSLGGTLGVGNLAGVACAITLGGPGAIFWMLIAAFLGMATKYSELVLAVKYRVYTPTPLGGPMVYLSRGAGLPNLAKIFAICCVLSGMGTGAAAQGSAIASALGEVLPIAKGWIGFLLALCLLPILYGGRKVIAQVSTILVPVMTIAYLFFGTLVLLQHLPQIPQACATIFHAAFDMASCTGGIFGFFTARAVSDGFAKGIFSNEAGMGSAPIAHGCSDVLHPCTAGMLGAVEVFLDTCVVCLMTALVLLTTGAWQSGADGLQMTILAFSTVLGKFSPIFIGIIVIFLSVSTILGWSFYGLACLRWLRAKHIIRILYPLAVALCAAMASYLPLTSLLLVTDIAAACMAFPNLIGLWLLAPQVASETKQFLFSQNQQAKQRPNPN